MIRLILLVVIAVLVLSFFGISIQALVSSPVTQANFAYLWQLLQAAWQFLQQEIQRTSLTLPFSVSSS